MRRKKNKRWWLEPGQEAERCSVVILGEGQPGGRRCRYKAHKGGVCKVHLRHAPLTPVPAVDPNELVFRATVLRCGQPTMGLRLEGNVIVDVPTCPCCHGSKAHGMTFELAQRWVAEAVLTRVMPGSNLCVFYRFGTR